MTELDSILMGMDSELFKNDHADYHVNSDTKLDKDLLQKYGVNDESEICYQEDIPNVLACSLLQPKDYDSNCSYQLVSLPAVTLVIKIDERCADGTEEGFNKYITEFVLESNDDVQSLSELHVSINSKSQNIVNSDVLDGAKVKQKLKWWFIPLTLFILLLFIGLGFLYFIFKFVK